MESIMYNTLKIFTLFGLLLIVSVSVSFADLQWEQVDTSVTAKGTETLKQTIYISGDRFAIETGDGLRMIFDIAAGTVVTIDTGAKSYTSTSLKELDEIHKSLLDQTDIIIEEALKGMPDDQKKAYREELEKQLKSVENERESVPTWQEYSKTGDTETIAGFAATRYSAKSADGGNYDVWCTKEVDTTELRTFLSRASQSSLMKDLGKDYAAVSLGFPLKSSTEKGGTKNTSVVTSISFKRIPSSVFLIPQGFKKEASPR